MTLIEAIKTGRRFRRIGTKEWFINHPDATEPCSPEYAALCMGYADVIAEDWEIEPVKKMVSRENIVEALRALQKKIWQSPNRLPLMTMEDMADPLAEELGLE